MENTKITKLKLATAFGIIVFLIVFIISSIFYFFINSSIKYEQFSKFEMAINSFIDNENTLEDLRNFKQKTKGKVNEKFGELNYLVLNKDDKVVSSYIVSNIKPDDFNKIIGYNSFDYNKIGNFFVKNVEKNNAKIFFFYELYYTDNDFIKNILIFFYISILSGIIIFFISRKIINLIFIPVEKNISDMNSFIHNAGHELQTPLSVIVSDIDFYTRSKIKEEYILQEIKSEARNMGELIKSLLKLSENNKIYEKENFNILEVINFILKKFSEKIKEKNISIQNFINKEADIEANKEHFFICLSNLISNSIRYNKQNGTIEINKIDGYFIIKDSGVGIERENLSKIFDRFYKEDMSRKSEGFGIGLSLVKKICDLNGWKIYVKSEKGKGSEFKLKI